MTNKAILGLGSNIKPEQNIEQARNILTELFNVKGESEFIQTSPVGYTQQDDFINGSVLIETELDKEGLKQKLKEIEARLGREVSTIKFGPRTIDIDIVVFNDEIVDKDFYERDFLKQSVLEIMPELNY